MKDSRKERKAAADTAGAEAEAEAVARALDGAAESARTAAANAEDKGSADGRAAREDAPAVDAARDAAVAEDGAKKQNTDKPFGKFGTPEALLKAYNELEKEFTRKSQRLKEAEREIARQSAPHCPDDEEWRAEVEGFFAAFPAAEKFAPEIAGELRANPALAQEKDCLYKALVRVLAAAHRTPEQLVADGQFLKDYVLGSPVVRAAVVGEYLRGLRNGAPPVVMGDGGQAGVLPPRKLSSIEEAGRLFLKENM